MNILVTSGASSFYMECRAAELCDSTGVTQRDLASFLPAFIMTHQRSSSEDTISSILTCTSETFHEFYSGPYDTDQLVADAKKSVLNRFRADLESNHSKCNRYKLLVAMLDHAPTDSGKRYVATCLAIAGTKGVDAVTETADQWLEHMFFKSE